MTPNLGTIDRIIRLIVGLVLIVAPIAGDFALFSGMTAKTIGLLVGVILVATATMKFCPLYRLLGVNTCKTSS